MGIHNIKIISFVFMILLVSTGTVLAFGVSSPYWDKNPLNMYPGQTKEVSFTLVNKASDPTANAFVSFDESAGIAELISGTQYTVQPGGTDKITFKISVPESATIGDSYNIRFSTKAAPSEEGGTVQLSIGYNINFPVNVVPKSEVPPEPEIEKKPEGLNTWWIISIILIILILIITIIISKRKR